MAKKTEEARPYHHGDLRTELLEAAVDVARERGVDGLSLRECARRAGVSHAAPYRHFADKNALLTALAQQGFARLAEAGRRAMEGVPAARDRLDAYGVAYVRFAVEHPIHFRLMFTRELDGASPAPGTSLASGATPASGPCADENAMVPDDAFALLVAAAGDAIGAEGEAALLAGVASWCLPHGLAMLILDGRIPQERLGSIDAVETLARQVLASWRDPSR